MMLTSSSSLPPHKKITAAWRTRHHTDSRHHLRKVEKLGCILLLRISFSGGSFPAPSQCLIQGDDSLDFGKAVGHLGELRIKQCLLCGEHFQVSRVTMLHQ